MPQHEHVQKQVIPDPEKKNQFDCEKQDDGPPEPKVIGNHESKSTAQNVAQGIAYRVAFITKGSRGGTVPLNDECGILDDLPYD
jgi:hypothetical protein